MDAGASCNGHFKAATKDELKRRVAEHFREKHKLSDPTPVAAILVEELAK